MGANCSAAQRVGRGLVLSRVRTILVVQVLARRHRGMRPWKWCANTDAAAGLSDMADIRAMG